MKVLHVYKTYYPDTYGGVEQVIRHLANGGKRHGIESEVFTFSHAPKAERFKFEKHFVTQVKTNIELSSAPFSLKAISKFKEIAPKFDLIHYHHPFPYGDVVKLLSAIKKPSIVTYHSDIVRQRILKYVYAPVQNLFLNSMDRIVCTSHAYLQTSPVLRKYKHKAEPVSLGLDTSVFATPSPQAIKKWRAQIQQPFFLFLGALRNYKGVATLLEAARGLDVGLVIAGGGSDLNRLQAKAKNLKRKDIHFTGRIEEDDKIALLELCYGLVLPSHLRSEAFGIVQLEAAMRAKPLICTELGTGTSYVNEHGTTGLVVPPKDPDALRAAMRFLLAHREIAERMGEEAEKRFNRLFSAERMCNDYARIYAEVLDGY